MSAPAGPRRAEAGFTLVETLVAMALVGLVTLLMLEGMRFVGAAVEGRQARTEALRALTGAAETLRGALEQAVVPPGADAFEGGAGGLAFVTAAPLPGRPPGTHELRLRLRAREGALDLVAEARTVGAEDWGAPRRIASGLSAGRFSYVARRGGAAERTEAWEGAGLPDLVELRASAGPIDWWPAIAVVPGAARMAR